MLKDKSIPPVSFRNSFDWIMNAAPDRWPLGDLIYELRNLSPSVPRESFIAWANNLLEADDNLYFSGGCICRFKEQRRRKRHSNRDSYHPDTDPGKDDSGMILTARGVAVCGNSRTIRCGTKSLSYIQGEFRSSVFK